MVTPALEIGGRLELAGMVSRACLNGGVSFASDDGWVQKRRFSMAGAGDRLPAFEAKTGTPRAYGNVKAGLEFLTRSGWELKAEYGLRAAKDHREQIVELRAALRFQSVFERN